ncbi:MAG: hypothetical protein ACJZ14_06215 [Candidatus Neomarinimicrobiota bacterium]
MVYKFLLYSLILCDLFGNVNWVNYGWELFDYVSEARTASLGNATVAYNFNYPSSALSNPYFSISSTRKISLTHQSRFAGLINSELVSVQIKKEERLINLNLIFEGISNIPDTRSALLDWGYDGQYGTNDLGESNGIIDEGERLDHNKITFFNQRRLGLYGTSNFHLRNIPFGIGFKILSSSLGDHNAIGVGLDFGFYKSMKNSNLGFVIKNIPASGMLWSNGNIEGTGPSIEFGYHQSFDILKEKSLSLNPMSSLIFSTSERHLNSLYYNGRLSVDVLFGLEAIYKEILMLRIGQNSLHQMAGGVGINWENLIVDYAFLPSSINGIFANHHLISLSIYLDWLIARIKENKN